MKGKLLFLAFIACLKTFAQKEEASPFTSKGMRFVGGTKSFSTLHDFKNPTLNFSVAGGTLETSVLLSDWIYPTSSSIIRRWIIFILSSKNHSLISLDAGLKFFLVRKE